jgi:uncharacterized Tic20 family protein
MNMEDKPQDAEQTDPEDASNDEEMMLEEQSEEASPEVVESQTPPAQLPGPALEPVPLSPSSARNWAMVSHLSILLNLFTGFLGPIVALIIYLAYKDRSRYVAYQAMQSFVFQLVFFVGAGALAAILWVITIPLMLLIIGCCLAPIAVLVSVIPFAAVVYGVVGGIQTAQGDDFRYWLVSDWVMPQEGSPGPS